MKTSKLAPAIFLWIGLSEEGNGTKAYLKVEPQPVTDDDLAHYPARNGFLRGFESYRFVCKRDLTVRVIDLTDRIEKESMCLTRTEVGGVESCCRWAIAHDCGGWLNECVVKRISILINERDAPCRGAEDRV